MTDKDDLAYELVSEYLDTGPEFLDISEACFDNGYDTDEDREYVANAVRESLQFLKGFH